MGDYPDVPIEPRSTSRVYSAMGRDNAATQGGAYWVMVGAEAHRFYYVLQAELISVILA